MAGQAIIETGVDRFLKLINEQERISFEDAAKRLSVPLRVIEEWAEFLEEEGVIKVEYRFTVPYLVKLELTKKELESKIEKFGTDKEIFNRKAESLVLFLEDQGSELHKIRQEFEKLKKEMSTGMKSLSQELKKFEEYQAFKLKIDEQIKREKEDLGKNIHEFNADIMKEMENYKTLSNKLKHVHEKVLTEYGHLTSLKKVDDNIRKKVDKLNSTIESVNKNILGRKSDIQISEKELSRLQKKVESSLNHIQKKRLAVGGLLASGKKEGEHLCKLQDELLMKAAKIKKELKGKDGEGEVAMKRFQGFVKKRIEIYNVLDMIEKQRQELLEYVKKLLIQAKSLNIMASSPELVSHIRELEAKFKEVDQKKDLFNSKLQKLGNLIKGK